MYPIDFHSICSPTMEVNGVYQLSGYWYSLKYLKKKETTVWNNLRVSTWSEAKWTIFPDSGKVALEHQVCSSLLKTNELHPQKNVSFRQLHNFTFCSPVLPCMVGQKAIRTITRLFLGQLCYTFFNPRWYEGERERVPWYPISGQRSSTIAASCPSAEALPISICR